MDFFLQEKIEQMRREPEHVRKRYVMIMVSFFMVLIFGIWLLSIQDSMTTAVGDVPGAIEKGKDLTGGAPSLSDLFDQSTPLRIEGKKTEGNEFFQEQQMQSGEITPDSSQ